jgi:hypothetical protein
MRCILPQKTESSYVCDLTQELLVAALRGVAVTRLDRSASPCGQSTTEVSSCETNEKSVFVRRSATSLFW